MPTRTGYGAPQLPHRPQHKPRPEQNQSLTPNRPHAAEPTRKALVTRESGLASGFRDQLGRSTPTDVELSVRTLSDPGGDAEFLVAVAENGAGAGFVQVRYRYSMWLSESEACLEDLFVAPRQLRTCLLGTKLVGRALERAVEKGCASLVVDTAVKLYRLGFSSSSSRWGMGRQLWFRKRLSPRGLSTDDA